MTFDLYNWTNELAKPEMPCVVDDHPDQVHYGMRVPAERYSRIVGYVRPVRNWNKGKKQEFAERQTYRVPKLAAMEAQ